MINSVFEWKILEPEDNTTLIQGQTNALQKERIKDQNALILIHQGFDDDMLRKLLM